MTLVVAMAGTGRGSVAIAADFRYSDTVVSDEYDNSKIVAVPVTGSSLCAYLGVGGVAVTPQILRSAVRAGATIPEREFKEPFGHWTSRAVVPFLKDAFDGAGITYQNQGFPECHGVQLVLAYDDSCALIESNYGVLVPLSGYTAIGGAEAIALGALTVASSLGLTPDRVVRAAMETAGALSSNVHGTYQYLRGDGTGETASTDRPEVLDSLGPRGGEDPDGGDHPA